MAVELRSLATLREPDDAIRLRREATFLLLCQNVLADAVGQAFIAVLSSLSPSSESRSSDADVMAAYGRLFSLLADEAELTREQVVGDAWQNHLLDRIISDENTFSRKARRASYAEAGPGLIDAMCHDLAILQALFLCDGNRLAEAVGRATGRFDVPEWGRLRSLADVRPDDSRTAMKRKLAAEPDWTHAARDVFEYYAHNSTGLFAEYRAFRWRRTDGRGNLVGVGHPDPITLVELIGDNNQRSTIVRNTEQFLAGLPANNVLLYGDRGTGKSSTVKALLARYGDDGLRLVEVSKHDLADFAEIVRELRDRPERFIVFVDDLSFDEHETDYKDLKVVLEGGLEARPDNVLVYATSNRRHLVQERFSDRSSFPVDDEIHAQDTLQEKLSLSDRFGITLTFLSPDQEQYLAIVAGLAGQRGLEIDPDDLAERALRWARLHNGRSGRTARQFVDQLTGEMRLSLDGQRP